MNREKSMKYPVLKAFIVTLLILLIACSNNTETAVSDPDSKPLISEPILRQQIATLASDDFLGRAPGTTGGEKTREYLIAEMKRIGLTPFKGSFEQKVPLVELTLNEEQSLFSINNKVVDFGSEVVFWTKRVVQNVEYNNSQLVFVGYGVIAPEYNWNDYEGVDVKGKTVVMLVNDPGYATGDDNLFNGNAMTYYGRWTYKFEEAARQGAAGAIVIHQTKPAAYGWGVIEGSWSGAQLDLERIDGGANRTALEGWVTETYAKTLFKQAGLDFNQLTSAAHKANFRAVTMGDLTASAKLTNSINRSQSANVVGMLPGSETPDEYVLYMAHWDHLGYKEVAKGDNKIANGAVDNATGTAGILAIAEAFTNRKKAPKRSLIFIAVTAEESGLLGSAYFAEDPLVPLANIVGGINIDAILPTPVTKDLIVVGYGASELEDILREAAQKKSMVLRPDVSPEKGYFYRSDHISLAKKGVPMIYADSGIDFIKGGTQAGQQFTDDYTKHRYHKPTDEYSADWDMSGMINTLELLFETGAAMAYSNQWPNWYEGNEFKAIRDKQRE